MDKKQANQVWAVIGVLAVVAAGAYLAMGNNGLGIGWNSSGYKRTDGTRPGQPTCMRYNLQDGAWKCTAVGEP